MPGVDGFGVIDAIGSQNMPAVVFITAFDHYALRAFEVHALDYLLKPVEKDRLAESIGRAKRFLESPPTEGMRAVTSGSADEHVSTTTATLEPAVRNKLVIRSHNRNFIIDARELIFATIDDGVITATAASAEGQLNYKTLEELQSNLDPESFWRAHRSYLVNIHRIREVVTAGQLQPL